MIKQKNSIMYRYIALLFVLGLLFTGCQDGGMETPTVPVEEEAPPPETISPTEAQAENQGQGGSTTPSEVAPEVMDFARRELRPQVRGLLYGYTNLLGKWVIEPQFDDARDFSEDLASVSLNGKYGFIDRKGNMVIESQFEATTDFSEGFVSVMQANKWGYLDKGGQMAIPPQFDYADAFSEGLAVIFNDNQYGYIDQNGEMIIPLQNYDFVQPFSEGMALVGQNNLIGYVDQSGQMVIEPQFELANSFSEGLAMVVKGNQAGFIDKAGQMVIEPQFDFAADFSEGLAAVVTEEAGNQLTGFINVQGQLVIDPQFNFAGDFSEGLAPVELEGKWGYIDPTGTMIIEPQFTFASNFTHGLAFVDLGGGRTAYIDKMGQIIFEVAPIESIIIGETIDLTADQVNFEANNVATNIQSDIVPAVPLAPGPVPGSPAFLRFSFDNPAPEEWFTPQDPQLLIFSTEDYRAVSGQIGNMIDAIQALLTERPASIERAIPTLPLIPAAQDFAVQVDYLDFANGSGVRFITKYAQEPTPVTNEDIFYTFQGLTNDGKYYIAFYYPVSSSVLPNTYAESQAAQNFEQFVDNFIPYMQETIQQLDSLNGAEFTPDLNQLDSVIQSLTITTE